MRRCWIRFTKVIVLLACLSFSVSGHAILTESNPTPRATIGGSHVAIRLKFNSRIDAPRCRLFLERKGAVQQVTIEKQVAADTLEGAATNLSPGAYQLRWQVLATDGHITRGEFPFNVR